MKVACLPLAAALTFSLAPVLALAQASAPLPGPRESAPRLPRPAPKLPTPAQQRDSATAPGELRPERPVLPQIAIPLGKTPPVPLKSAARRARGNGSGASGGVDDAAARCEALADAQARALCLEKSARAARQR